MGDLNNLMEKQKQMDPLQVQSAPLQQQELQTGFVNSWETQSYQDQVNKGLGANVEADEENLNKELDSGNGLSQLKLYDKRNEIMRARMDGMINAAKVKATSKENEKYRIAKARISCRSELYDQARELSLETTEEKAMLTTWRHPTTRYSGMGAFLMLYTHLNDSKTHAVLSGAKISI